MRGALNAPFIGADNLADDLKESFEWLKSKDSTRRKASRIRSIEDLRLLLRKTWTPFGSPDISLSWIPPTRPTNTGGSLYSACSECVRFLAARGSLLRQ